MKKEVRHDKDRISSSIKGSNQFYKIAPGDFMTFFVVMVTLLGCLNASLANVAILEYHSVNAFVVRYFLLYIAKDLMKNESLRGKGNWRDK